MLMRLPSLCILCLDAVAALHAATDDATATTTAATGRVHEATDDDGRAGETATRVDAGEFPLRVLVFRRTTVDGRDAKVDATTATATAADDDAATATAHGATDGI
jgi:hypothetical protein